MVLLILIDIVLQNIPSHLDHIKKRDCCLWFMGWSISHLINLAIFD
jgi:hypothetical protein